MLVLVWLAVCVCMCARAQDEVRVEVIRLPYEQSRTLLVNRSVEYLVEFEPTEQQRAWPTRVTARATAGDAARPVLLTARQRSGATTWQLPYYHEQRLLYELTRTLCPDGAGGGTPASPECEGGVARAVSLHVGSACAAPVAVTLRAEPAADFLLGFDTADTFHITQTAPLVALFRWPAELERARLVASSEDEACATVSVQNYTCPIAQTMDTIDTVGLRMTVERSGAVQVSRAAYPFGFLVVVVARASDEACRGAREREQDWLLPAAVWGQRPDPDHHQLTTKQITFTVKAALSRGQYVLAAALTLALFLAFYLAFGALLLARGWPPLARRVRSRAVLAAVPDGQPSQTDAGGAASSPPRRRDSTATFDSSDNSDTDSDEEPSTIASSPAPPPAAPAPPPAAPAPPPAAPAPPPAAPAPPGAGPPAVGGPVSEPDAGAPVPAESHSATAPAESNGRVANESNQRAEGARPFGLPARLRLAALARRRGRVLRARSDRYLATLYTVAVFYALPVVQFVAAFQMILNVSGSLDLCYYNFLCAHPAGALADFNHVFSNAGYLLLGALLLLQEYGIPAHYGLLSALGAGMMVVALLSASYHVCPNRLNFQFDVAFMYVLAVLSMVKLYQARHPDVNARAHATFGVLAALIAIVVWGVLGGGALFWGAATVLHVFAVLLLSLRIYYVGQFRLEKQSLVAAARGLGGLGGRGGLGALGERARPLYAARLALLLVANAVNWAFALYGLFTQAADFASHLLNVLLANALVYMLFYLTMKLLHGERPRWYAWCYLAGALAAWAPALYFFLSGSTDWSATPAQSRHRNHECMVLEFYDAHDLWHLLSAAALYLSFAAIMTWDDGLAAVKRTDIAVF